MKLLLSLMSTSIVMLNGASIAHFATNNDSNKNISITNTYVDYDETVHVSPSFNSMTTDYDWTSWRNENFVITTDLLVSDKLSYTFNFEPGTNYINKASESHKADVSDRKISGKFKELNKDPMSLSSDEIIDNTEKFYDHTLHQGMARYQGIVRVGIVMYYGQVYILVRVEGSAWSFATDNATTGLKNVTYVKFHLKG